MISSFIAASSLRNSQAYVRNKQGWRMKVVKRALIPATHEFEYVKTRMAWMGGSRKKKGGVDQG